MSYVELHACSAFSFLRGASFPEQLAERAAELELPVVALLDRNGVYGAQRFSVACREHGVRPIVGADLTMEDGSLLPVLVENRAGYKNLCELLTQAHLRSEKGSCLVGYDELAEISEGLIAFFSLAPSKPHLGSARVSPAGCRRLAATNFRSRAPAAKVRDREDAIASTRDRVRYPEAEVAGVPAGAAAAFFFAATSAAAASFASTSAASVGQIL